MGSNMTSQTIKKVSINWHKKMAILAGITLLIWGGSGLFHTLMVHFGPQQAVFYPPSRAVDLSTMKPVKEILEPASITQAAAVRVVPGPDQNLLQVTETPFKPRRYFNLETGAELIGHDQEQAVFLARHYTGSDTPIRAITFVTEFNGSYPSVNRLLPVYKVDFDSDDDLSIYVYTETGASAAVNNRAKTILQTGFQWFHTLSWFPKDVEIIRVLVVLVLIGSLLIMSLSGLGMLLKIKRKKRAPGLRGWHRLATFGLGFPVFLLTVSGIFHLVSMTGVPDSTYLQLPEPMQLADVDFPIEQQWADISKGLNVTSVSLVKSPDGEALYRLGLRPNRGQGPESAADIRSARFAGVPTNGPAVYMNARTGQPYADGDQEIARQLAEYYTGETRDSIKSMDLITRFGPLYDFRNKRLPVWKVDYGDPVSASIFIDTTTGVLADKLPYSAIPERMSFSLAHKWNFLRAFGGPAQNIIVMTIVSLSLIFLAGFGLRIALVKPGRKAKRPGPKAAEGTPAE